MANGVSRETFDGMDTDSKLGVLFDYAKDNHKAFCELRDKVNSQRWWNTTVSGITGLVGGALAVFGIKLSN